MTPGSIITTLTPNGASSNLKDSLSPSKANLELMYAGDAGNPIRPTTELTFTIVPEPAFSLLVQLPELVLLLKRSLYQTVP